MWHSVGCRWELKWDKASSSPSSAGNMSTEWLKMFCSSVPVHKGPPKPHTYCFWGYKHNLSEQVNSQIQSLWVMRSDCNWRHDSAFSCAFLPHLCTWSWPQRIPGPLPWAPRPLALVLGLHSALLFPRANQTSRVGTRLHKPVSFFSSHVWKVLVPGGSWPCLGQSSWGLEWKQGWTCETKQPIVGFTDRWTPSHTTQRPQSVSTVCRAPWWEDTALPSRCSQPKAEANGWLKWSEWGGTCCHPPGCSAVCVLFIKVPLWTCPPDTSSSTNHAVVAALKHAFFLPIFLLCFLAPAQLPKLEWIPAPFPVSSCILWTHFLSTPLPPPGVTAIALHSACRRPARERHLKCKWAQIHNQ